MGDKDAPDGFTPHKLQGKVGKGKIVGSYFRQGDQVKGDAQAEFVEVQEAAKAQAAQAMEKTKIPRKMADYVEDYINSLNPERQ
ncbi:MAG: hypothetical protein KDD82_20340 [Planctomycetes bacterium]|nr:hypothetical protein [Planctomycetota bacterium]